MFGLYNGIFQIKYLSKIKNNEEADNTVKEVVDELPEESPEVEPDEDIFFMRIHANISNMVLDKNNFSNLISDFKSEIDVQIYYYDYLKPLNMAILCTKEEGPVLELILKKKSGKLNFT